MNFSILNKLRLGLLKAVSIGTLTFTFNVNSNATIIDAGNIEVTDAAENLLGDSTRGFLDIRSIEIETRENVGIISIQVGSTFPSPESMLGTGFRYSIFFYKYPTLDGEDPQPSHLLHEARITYGPRGWDNGIYLGSDVREQLDEWLSFEAGPTSLKLSLPATYLTAAAEIRVISTTEDYPKWRPITLNPTIKIHLAKELTNRMQSSMK